MNLVDPDGRRIKIVDGEEEEEYVLNSQYTGENEYIDLMYSALNEICSINKGKAVLYPLIFLDDIYTIRNISGSKESTNSYNEKDKIMNIFIDETIENKMKIAIESIAHESFHAYQLYKGSSINTIHSEVEAYIYMDIINYRLFDIFPTSLYSRNNHNASYDSLLYSIYYDPSFNIQKFDILVNQFKSFSKTAREGVL